MSTSVRTTPSSRVEVASAPHAPNSWRLRDYLVNNLGISLAVTAVSYFGLLALGGQDLFNMWIMVTSHVHFCMSYCFHYASVKRSLTTTRNRAAFWGFFVFGSFLFPVLYLKVVPYPLNSFLFMSYFMVHMMRDEQLMCFQRSTSYQERPKSHFAFVWLILITLLSVVAIFAPFRGSDVPEQDLLPSVFRSDYLLLGMLVAIAVGGVYALWRCETVRLETRLASCVALLASTTATGLFGFQIATHLMSWDLNGPVIYLHYISWYLFGGGRIADFEHRLKTGQIPPVQSTDPWFKYKSSTKNFLKLVGVIHLVLVPLGLIWLINQPEWLEKHGLDNRFLLSLRHPDSPLHWLNYAFDKRYLPILSFPHITLHFLPTNRFQPARPTPSPSAAPVAAS